MSNLYPVPTPAAVLGCGPHLTLGPTDRLACTHQVRIGHGPNAVSVRFVLGYRPDTAEPMELFIFCDRPYGDPVSALLHVVARLSSYLLQQGWTCQQLIDTFRYLEFAPSGPTDQPDRPWASSILDYLAQWLSQQLVQPGPLITDPCTTDRPMTDPGPVGSNQACPEPSPDERAGSDRSDRSGRARSVGLLDASLQAAIQHVEQLLQVKPAEPVRSSQAPAGLDHGQDRSVAWADAVSCPTCGGLTRRSGTCYVCPNCGTTTGCS